ncbi:MAG: hypothetical protein ACRC4N_06200 [Gammaproteobacteria bacterium]
MRNRVAALKPENLSAPVCTDIELGCVCVCVCVVFFFYIYIYFL